MAVGDTDTLTDAELIAELAEYGEEIKLPIKANKRPILVKKLNHLKARAKQQNSLNKSTKSKPPTPLTPPPPAARTSRSTAQLPVAGTSRNVDTVKTNSDISSQNSSRYSSSRLRSKQPVLDSFSSDDSDTEPLLSESPNQSLRQQYTNRNITAQNDSLLDRSTASSRRPVSQFSDSILRTIRRRTGEQLPPPRRTSRRSNNGVFELSAEQNRFNNSLDESNDASRTSRLNATNDRDDSPVPSPARSKLYPNLSNFTSFLSNNGRKQTQTNDKFESSDADSDFDASTYEVENKSVNTSFPPVNNISFRAGNNVTPSSSVSQTSSKQFSARRRNSGRHRVQQYKSAIAEHLPHILVAIVALFFIVLLVTYAANHKDLIFSWISTNNIGSHDELLLALNDVPDEKSYTKGEINRAIEYISAIFAQLSERKGEVMCETEKSGHEFISVESLKKRINKDTVSDMTAHRLLQCCLEHIMVNPHWNMRGLQEDGSPAETASDVIKLESTVASMSLACRLRRSVSTVLYGLFISILVMAMAGLGFMCVQRRTKQKEQQQREVFIMVERIIDLLQEHHEQTKSDGETAYLAVQHVRDQLLPPAHRKKLQPTWDAAFEFIAANESRIRLETRLIHGDEFEVWHWLPQTTTNGKIWQGQAFGELNDSTTNQRMICPTPCLKIRNMFDSNVESDEGWEETVVDAVLEKLKAIRSVIHVFVDTESTEGCVYLKCDSRQAAGMARSALHGWWFDGRLVTAKHLKLDHYHKRWPEAREACTPLAPSSDANHSLSQPYHRSSLEMT